MKRDKTKNFLPTQTSRRLDPLNKRLGSFSADAERKAKRRAKYGPTDQFFMDLEVTGLRSEMVFNPDRITWERDIRQTELREYGRPVQERLKAYRTLRQAQYFENTYLAQVGMITRSGKLPLGMGYSHWGRPGASETELWELARDGTVKISDFSLRKGIISRSVEAFRAGEAKSEIEIITDFANQIQQSIKAGKRVKWSNWNAWFDVMATQAVLARHAESLSASGINPFLLMDAYNQGLLQVEETEEFFFDLLRAKGFSDPNYAERNFLYGKYARSRPGRKGMFDLPGVRVGQPINLVRDAKRRKLGLPSFFRSKFGWTLEGAEKIFTKYLKLTPEELAIQGLDTSALTAHEAIRDTAVTRLLSKKFSKAAILADMYRAEGIVNPMAIAMAKTGFLGPEFLRPDLAAKEYAFWMQGGGQESILSRAISLDQDIWNRYTKWTKLKNLESSQLGALFEKSGSRRVVPKLGELGLGAEFGFQKAWAAQKFAKLGSYSRRTLIGLGVFGASSLLYGLAKKRSGPDSNLPPNYIQGQQVQKKIIEVPWASPYQGPEQDNARAWENNFLHLAPFAIPSILQRIYGKLPKQYQQNVYLATRFLEDLTPFRVGRIFGLSGKFSSFLSPNELAVPFQQLATGSRLTPYGGAFARAMNLGDDQFLNFMQSRMAAGEEGLHFVKSNGPFMQLSGSDIHLRFYEGTSRIGMSFGQYGAPEASVRPMMQPAYIRERVRQLLYPTGDPYKFTGRLSQWRSIFLRFLHDKIPGGERYLERFASIPKWDRNPYKWMQRTRQVEDIWIPGYLKGKAGIPRLVGGSLFDFFRSPWHLMRSGGAALGIDVGPATNLRTIARKASKYGLMTYAGITAFSYVNESLRGALTAPIWNIYERAKIAQAKISDKMGFTEIRKQHEKVYPWSAAAVLTLPLITLGILKYGRRATVANFYEARGTRDLLAAGRPTQWRAGGTMGLREIPFARAGKRVEVAISRSRLFTRLIEDPTTGRRIRQLTPLAKFGAAAWLGIGAALFTPFIFGTKYTEEEYRDIFAGRKKVPIRRGRFWELGNTPFEGGRVAYFRMHQAARRKLDAEQEVPGTRRRSIIRSLINPYWREKESYYTRPYPITGTPFEEVPFVGPLLARTIGRFFKPPKLMHTEEWTREQPYEPFGPDMAPSPELGGLNAPLPQDPLGRKALVREGFYKATEFMGLRGFFFQSVLFESAFGGQAPYARAHTLQPSRFKGFTERWYEAEVGGMAGTNELFRRLFPRPQRGVQVNPLRNQMPRWMPGSEYFINFKEGDPYSKIPYGEERLPGPGFEKRYPQLRGLPAEKYPSWAKYEILADVAPWATQTRIWKSLAFKEFGEDPRMRAHLEEITWESDRVKQKKDFANYDFNRDLETIKGTVSEVLPTGEFRLQQYPHHLFKPAGLRFGVAATSQMLRNINSLTKADADQRAYESQFAAQEFMIERMLGQQVKLKIGIGGLNRPDVDARIFSDGTNINRELARRGLAAPEGQGAPTASFAEKIYGKVIEGIGHIPQKVPGPFFLFSKFYNEADPIEEYQRSMLYGSEVRFWNKPYENFIRPYLLQTIAKLTPGEFEPAHVKERRRVDVLFDRLQFMKSYQAGQMGKAARTAVGVDALGAEQIVTSAMPYRERPYFQEFLKETDSRRRERILSMVSADMQRALLGQWTRQYLEASGQPIPKASSKARMAAAYQLSANEIQKAGYKVPPRNWVGWNQGVEVEDVKATFLRSEGLDHHEYNIWDDRIISLNRKPYLKGSEEYLTSRPMAIPSNILSNGFDRRRREMTVVSEHLSRSLVSNLTIYNQTDRRAQDEREYLQARDSLLVS